MTAPIATAGFSLRATRTPLAWCLLLALSALLITPLQIMHLPAALLLGAMAAAGVMAVYEARLTVPRPPYALAQALIGCLVARSIGLPILLTMLHRWPVFLVGVLSVLFVSSALGIVLTRWRVLPGTTAIWGSAPGAATVMVLLSESFGGDPRLVAFMQFLRVMLVALVAAVVTRLWVTPGMTPPVAVDWFPQLATGPCLASLGLALGGAALGLRLGIPAGPLLLPLFAGIGLSAGGWLVITLPPILMAGCYLLVGWAIGLRFTATIVRYAARAFPAILASTMSLIALCGALAWALHRVLGTDPLTAYLATSPGGADSVAIIATSAPVDVPFVMAMQMARFLVVLLLGPALARLVARWVVPGRDASSATPGDPR